MAEATYKFEDQAGQTFELTAAEIESKVFAHRNVKCTVISPADLRGVSWFGLWPQDHEALFKLREIEASDEAK